MTFDQIVMCECISPASFNSIRLYVVRIAPDNVSVSIWLTLIRPTYLVVLCPGLLAARAATRATGNTESSTGLRLETLFRSGTARPIIEAFTAYQQDLQNIECAQLLPRA